jgi:hypothetical protein
MNHPLLIVADFLIGSCRFFMAVSAGRASIAIGSFTCLSNVCLMENW